MIHKIRLLFASALLCATPLHAAGPPDPLTVPEGTVATSPEIWREHVRPETLKLFRQQVYGERPVGKPDDFKAEVVSETAALDGTATRKEILLSYSGPGGNGEPCRLTF